MSEQLRSKITEQQAEKIVGGGTTVMYCYVCNYSIPWAGNYFKKAFDCPKCGVKDVFLGIRYAD